MRLDLTGQRFGRLTAMHPESAGRRSAWRVLCDCGMERIVNSDNLRSGNTKSCGCAAREIAKVCASALNHRHGMSRSRTWYTWASMLQRCGNPKNKVFANYGGRGIAICDRWRVFENFLTDMGERPEGMTLDRINNDGNYEPGNCRWATIATQNRNRRSIVNITFGGKTMCVSDWARELGMGVRTLWFRIESGWDIERALTQPVRKLKEAEAAKKPASNVKVLAKKGAKP